VRRANLHLEEDLRRLAPVSDADIATFVDDGRLELLQQVLESAEQPLTDLIDAPGDVETRRARRHRVRRVIAPALAIVTLGGAGAVAWAVTSHPVRQVSVTVNPFYPEALASYTVGFTASAAVPAGGDILLSEAAGPTDFSSGKGFTAGSKARVLVDDPTEGWRFQTSDVAFGTGVTTSPLGLRGAGPSAAGAMEVPLRDAIKAGDSVTVLFTAVNPPPGNVSDFKVYTTSTPTGGVAFPYTIETVAESMYTNGCVSPPYSTCYSPQAFRTAYGISPLLARGINGNGRTIVIPEPTDVPSDPAVTNIFQSLWAYDTYFHLPPVKLTVVPGTATKAAADLAGFTEVADVEAAHAVAPGAAIRVVLGNFNSNVGSVQVSLLKAVLSASKGADVAYLDDVVPEDCLSPSQLAEAHSVISQLAARRITVIAPEGFLGVALQPCTGPGQTVAKKGVYYPASDPLVLAVGGTKLTANPNTGAYGSEVAWNEAAFARNPHFASGGGFSSVIPSPSYQDGVPGVGRYRGVPDVAGSADGSAGLALINEFASGSFPDMQTASGTNQAAGLWAGLAALADQYASHDLGPIGPAIYRIAQSTEYHRAFHDITSGNNTYVVAGKKVEGYNAGPGWDPVTGWGTPVASVLVPLLARNGTS
jgi:hypothetical protein